MEIREAVLKFNPTEFQMWRLIRERGIVTPASLSIDLECSVSTTYRYLGRLLEGGYLRIVSKADRERPDWRYRLIRNTGAAAPVFEKGEVYDPNMAGEVKFAQQKIWNTLRISRLSIAEIVLVSGVSSLYTGQYLSALEVAEYLGSQRVYGGAEKRGKTYWVRRDTGPLCPVVQFSRNHKQYKVFDQNLAQFVDITGDQNHDEISTASGPNAGARVSA
jgi:hypothetical protein